MKDYRPLHKKLHKSDQHCRDDPVFGNTCPGKQCTCRSRLNCSWRSSLIRVFTVCHSVCIFWKYYFMANPYCSNLGLLQHFFSVRIFGFLQKFNKKINSLYHLSDKVSSSSRLCNCRSISCCRSSLAFNLSCSSFILKNKYGIFHAYLHSCIV